MMFCMIIMEEEWLFVLVIKVLRLEFDNLLLKIIFIF